MGDSLALLLRISECCNQPPDLEGSRHIAGTGLATDRSLDRVAFK